MLLACAAADPTTTPAGEATGETTEALESPQQATNMSPPPVKPSTQPPRAGGGSADDASSEQTLPSPAASADAGSPPQWVTSGDAGSAPQLACPRPTSYSLSEWLPYEPEVPAGVEPARALLQGVQDVMAGSWRGLATTPWMLPYVVDITFSADGHYSAHCSELGDCCVAFYYGTDLDTPLKQVRLDATLSGNVFGEIDIIFDNFGELYSSGWQGKLSHIERDASGNGLRFEFSRSDSRAGPVRYDLRRVQ